MTINQNQVLDVIHIRRLGWKDSARKDGHSTILIILAASWRCGTSASLLGQGDNQVILLRIPENYLTNKGLTRDQYIDNYLVVLRDLCDRAKIVVKLKEM